MHECSCGVCHCHEKEKPLAVSFFSGAGGLDLGFEMAGWEIGLACELDKYACMTFEHNHPNTILLKERDICTVTGEEIKTLLNGRKINAVIGGPPCFIEGTLILCRDGLKDIKDIQVGDEVYTHLNRWRKVSSVMNREASTIKVKGWGAPDIITTKEHPFYAYKRLLPYGPTKVSLVLDGWVEAEKLKDKYWASPSVFSETEIPPFQYNHPNEKELPVFSEAFFWFIGAWLGDGWFSDHDRGGHRQGQTHARIILCGNKSDEYEIRNRLKEAGLHAYFNQERTTCRFTIGSKPLFYWMLKNFGRYSHGKKIPTWCFGMAKEYRKALLDGYMFADGNFRKERNAFRASSTSKEMIIGLKLLSQSLGMSACAKYEPKPKTCQIEGRTVNQKDQWGLSIQDLSRESHLIDGYRCGLVKSVEDTGLKQKVYNIAVEEDESYVADGIVVHNCQGHSLSGARLADDPRNQLFMEFLRLVSELKPDLVVAENVKGLLSTDKGKFIKSLVYEYEQIGYKVEYKVLNAADFGVPQTRERVIFIANPFGLENTFPKPTHCNPKKMQLDLISEIKPWVTVGDAIGDLPYLDSGDGHEVMEYNAPPTTPYQKYSRSGDVRHLDGEV